MASHVADAGFIVSLLNDRDAHHSWARAEAANSVAPWHTTESVLSEAFHLLTPRGARRLLEVLRRGVLRVSLDFSSHQDQVILLMEKYADSPISLGDACIVRLTEILPDPIVLTTDSDFRIYRRNGRQTIPCRMPK